MPTPRDPDPYIDETLQNPGEPPPGRAFPFERDAPAPEGEVPAAPEWPEGQVPPEEQSDG